MRCLIFLLATISIIAGSEYEDGLDEQWKSFKKSYKKIYDTEEDATRRDIWNGNAELMRRSNKAADEGRITYWMKETSFSDMTVEEIKEKKTGLLRKSISKLLPSKTCQYSGEALPDSVDWRKKGIVTKVKNQGDCGSCWAFAATGSLEGLYALKTGKLISLSEQNLVDCSGKEGNNGCNGGLMTNAFQYIADNKGIDTEASYPYRAINLKCRFNRTNVGATDSGFVNLPKGDEQGLKAASAVIGPIAVAIDGDHIEFMQYRSGVLYIPNCSTTRLTYSPTLVGYGVENGTDYWLLKTSYSVEFGEEGYVKLARNRNNLCGIASLASYPVVL